MKMKELLDSEEKWTKGTYARDKRGKGISPICSNAVCFCLLGAIEKCYSSEKKENLDYAVISKIRRHLNLRTGTIACWNDAPERTFEEVKSLVEELDI